MIQVRRVGAKPPVEREPYSLYVCGLKNPVRKRLIEIVEHKLFEVRITTKILFKTVTLSCSYSINATGVTMVAL